MLTSGVTAHAADPTLKADDVAELVRDASPQVLDLEQPRDASNGTLTAGDDDGVKVLLPAVGTGGVELMGGPGQGLIVGLPAEAAASGRGAIADDGTVMYEGRADVAVQVHEEGVRVHTVLADESAPSEYEYAFEGAVPKLLADGSVELVVEEGGLTAIVGTVAAPWAVDASGSEVPTRYRVVGSSLVQEVDHGTPDVTYPVVADPSVSLGRYIYVRYSKSEVKRAASYVWTNRFVALVCVAIPNPIAAAGCAIALDNYASSIVATWQSAARNNRCMELRYWYNGVIVSWKSYSC